MKTFRKLTVSPDREAPGTYLVLIGKTKVGWVRRKDKDGRVYGTTFTFLPELGAFPQKEAAPGIFITQTMQGIRQGLSEKISHDTYSKILENDSDSD